MEVYITPAEIARQKSIAAGLAADFAADGRKPGVFIRTFGCQQNEADSEKLYGTAELCGYTRVADEASAELIIINTCAIREHAELKTMSITGGYRKLKEKNPSLLIMMCGCMAQEKHIRDKLYKSYPYVDAVFGTDMHHRLPEIISEALTADRRISYISDLPHTEFGVISEDMPVTRLSPYRAWVSVMYGCNNYCTYCVVPYVRGRERSRTPENILAETNALINRGYRDITLLGQNVNSYAGGISFPELLKRVAEPEGEYRVRFMTSHPKDASRELAEVMASSERIAKHFHLPVQSGNDTVLKRMNRHYTSAEYLEKVAFIREYMPDVTLTTDIICGFPGETDEQFADTLSLVKKVGFDMIYTFIYSPRPGTSAAEMASQIPHEEQVRRFDLLSEAENEIALGINRALVGKTLRVLSDGASGRTDGNKTVNFTKPVTPGIFVDALITEAHPYALDGEVKTDNKK